MAQEIDQKLVAFVMNSVVRDGTLMDTFIEHNGDVALDSSKII